VLGGEYADLVCTDPPFAIYGSSTGIGADIADDKMVRPFFERVLKQLARVVPDFGHIYVFCDWRSWGAIWDSAKRAQLSPKNLLVWDKGNGGLGGMYANCHELVGFFAKLPPPKSMKSGKEAGERCVFAPNILRYARASGEERNHNASKPVELVRELIRNSSDKGAVVLDLFNGGGTTLIACEREGRRYRGLDIEPREVDKTIRRWEKLTGGRAERVGE
jgi:DNA modification methylase